MGLDGGTVVWAKKEGFRKHYKEVSWAQFSDQMATSEKDGRVHVTPIILA